MLINNELKAILSHLQKKRGLDFSGYRSFMLKRQIAKRLLLTHSENFDEYLSCLQEHPEELEKLADAYLAKPIDEYVLAAQVKTALRIKETEEQL